MYLEVGVLFEFSDEVVITPRMIVEIFPFWCANGSLRSTQNYIFAHTNSLFLQLTIMIHTPAQNYILAHTYSFFLYYFTSFHCMLR